MDRVTKKCNDCDRELEATVNNFYVRYKSVDGLSSICKTCREGKPRSYRRNSREGFARYDRERNKTPERREKKLVYQRGCRTRNPERSLARSMVSKAIKSKVLIKKPCENCGNPNSQAHHNDYSKPLDVVWVCFKCHRELYHNQTVIRK